MALVINGLWVTAYIILGAIMILGILYSLLISIKDFKGSFLALFISSLIINIAIVIHTFAIIQVGNDKVATAAFITSHILLFIGFIIFATLGKDIKELSDTIGFG